VTESKLLDKTLDDLEWPRIEAAVAELRRAPSSTHRSLPQAETRAVAEQGLSETAEALALMRAGEPLPLDGIRDIGLHLTRLERHGALDAPALHELRLTLGTTRSLRRFLAARRERLPALTAACSFDPTLDRVFDTLSEALDPEGTLADHASAELKRLRIETRNLRAHMIARLEELVHKHAELLSDTFYTLRDGRYVLPVRSDAHERVHGIVHGASASGSTIFVEPRSLIVQGNRLKLAEAEEEREVVRVLAALSDEVRGEAPSIRTAFESLLHADLRAACAKLCERLGLTRPVLAEKARIRLRQAKHPMLLLDGVEVVANDVEAEAGHALVISGPNAGGKTVALKLLGLSALMVRTGLFLPAEEGSECGFFDSVLSDIGDAQSLSKNLSTFSAHVRRMTEVIDVAGEGALVLLDELAGSTDPEEGAALACAVVERLCEQRAAVAVTTHYEPLKARALRDARLRNASVGFDVARMAPTFRLRLGVPGASSALAVAERFGMPHAVVERARTVLPEQSKHFDALVKQLEHHLNEVEAQRAQVDADRRATKAARDAVEHELAQQKAREKKQLGSEAQALMLTLREARNEIDRAKKAARQGALSNEDLRALNKRLDVISAETVQSEQVRTLLSSPREESNSLPVAFDELAVGKRVYAPHLRAEVEVLEPPHKGRVRVAAGAMRLWVDIDQLRKQPQAKPEPASSKGKTSSLTINRPSVRSSDNSLDLRGMRVEDALDMLDAFLDRMYGRDESVAYVEHGFGSGALREAVREHLARPSPYVAGVRAGAPDEGGERVTIVSLR
jgi:DNA mismatch repair protein MutS2